MVSERWTFSGCSKQEGAVATALCQELQVTGEPIEINGLIFT
jgi:hypothetical protein